jgi:hypothetical protein
MANYAQNVWNKRRRTRTEADDQAFELGKRFSTLVDLTDGSCYGGQADELCLSITKGTFEQKIEMMDAWIAYFSKTRGHRLKWRM